MIPDYFHNCTTTEIATSLLTTTRDTTKTRHVLRKDSISILRRSWWGGRVVFEGTCSRRPNPSTCYWRQASTSTSSSSSSSLSFNPDPFTCHWRQASYSELTHFLNFSPSRVSFFSCLVHLGKKCQTKLSSSSEWHDAQLRIQFKLNTALLSTVRVSVRSCVTGVTSHISHIYKGINAMLIIRGPIKPSIFWIKITLAIQKWQGNTNKKTKTITKTKTKTKTPRE